MTPEAQARMALQAVRADWLRSVPSALGVIIGIALLVALSASRWGRHFRREIPSDPQPGKLSAREREVGRLLANTPRAR